MEAVSAKPTCQRTSAGGVCAAVLTDPQIETTRTRGFAKSLRAFLADFARYAGRRGIAAGALVAAGAVFESLSLVLLIPILGVVVDSGPSAGGLRRLATRLFLAVGAQSQLERLAFLLAIFAVLMVVRAVIVTWRDVRLAELQIGFLESQRAAVAELLANARWDQLVRRCATPASPT